jgi:hypothetical protein
MAERRKGDVPRDECRFVARTDADRSCRVRRNELERNDRCPFESTEGVRLSVPVQIPESGRKTKWLVLRALVISEGNVERGQWLRQSYARIIVISPSTIALRRYGWCCSWGPSPTRSKLPVM